LAGRDTRRRLKIHGNRRWGHETAVRLLWALQAFLPSASAGVALVFNPSENTSSFPFEILAIRIDIVPS